MTTASPLALNSESLVGEVVAARPALARLFQQLQIDYCCGGRQSRAAAAASRGLSPSTLVALVDAALATIEAGPVEIDAAQMSLTALADHIESTHHAYLKEELPRLTEMAERVAYKHGHRDARLQEIAETTHELAAEMLCHMEKEEQILFPLVRRLEAGDPALRGNGLAGPIGQMEAEHQGAGDAIARLRLLTDGFRPDGEACNTHRALLDGLARFEGDLHRHVHKENNVLFPRALRLAAG